MFCKRSFLIRGLQGATKVEIANCELVSESVSQSSVWNVKLASQLKSGVIGSSRVLIFGDTAF